MVIFLPSIFLPICRPVSVPAPHPATETCLVSPPLARYRGDFAEVRQSNYLGAPGFRYGFSASKRNSISAMSSSVSFNSEKMGDAGMVLPGP
jgi:hypothetical protein